MDSKFSKHLRAQEGQRMKNGRVFFGKWYRYSGFMRTKKQVDDYRAWRRPSAHIRVVTGYEDGKRVYHMYTRAK